MPAYLNSVVCCNGFKSKYLQVAKQNYEKSDNAIYSKLNRYGNEKKAIEIASLKYLEHERNCICKPSEMNPKYFSKNCISFSITFCFLTSRPPPNLDTGGRILSMSVPVVFNVPSRNELSMNFRVSFCLSFSSLISSSRSVSFCSWTNLRQSSSTFVEALTVSMKFSISSFLLRSWILEPIALLIETSMFLSSQLDAWYLATSMRM